MPEPISAAPAAFTCAFTLNDQPVEIACDPKASALDVLRGLGVGSIKAGCAPQGLCGCCTILVNDSPRLSCTLPVKTLAGKRVATLEGLPEADRDLLAGAITEARGAQCGYCTPGILLSAHALIRQKSSPEEEDIRRALNQHLCRCTGYTPIIEGIQQAAACRRGEAEVAPCSAGDRALALGERPSLEDLSPPGVRAGVLIFAAGTGRLEGIDGLEGAGVSSRIVVLALKQPGEPVAAFEPVLAICGADSIAAGCTEAEVRRAAAGLRVRLMAAAGGEGEAGGRAADVWAWEEGAAPAGAAFTAELSLRAPFADPGFLEPEAALAVPIPGGLHLYTAAERILGSYPDALIRMVPSGGSYGGRIDGAAEQAACALARQTGRPVRVALTWEEGARLRAKRPAMSLSGRASMDAAGRLLAWEIAGSVDIGAGCADGAGLWRDLQGGIAWAADRRAIRLEIRRSGAVRTARAPGAALPLQALMEGLLDQLAARSGRDRLSLRLQNVVPEAREVLAALEPAWALEGGARGIGAAVAPGASALESATVALRVVSAQEIEVHCSVPDLGQGRDAALLRALAAVIPAPDLFSFPFSEVALVGRPVAARAPVAAAARSAAARLLEALGGQAGGPLAGLAGRVFIGTGGPGAAGAAAALVTGRADGTIGALYVAGACAGGADSGVEDPALQRSLISGGALSGVGLALSEEAEIRDGLPEVRLRMLGLLKPKVAPEILALPVEMSAAPGEREVTGAAAGAAGAAIFSLSGTMSSGAAGGAGLKALGRSPQAPIRAV